jgi:hypothetical protein
VTLAQARDLAIVLLVLEAMVFCIIPLTIAYFAVKGLRALRAKLFIGLRWVRLLFTRITRTTERASHVVTQPIMKVGMWQAKWRGMVRAVRVLERK